MILGAYTLDFEGLKEAKANGYPCWIFAPNPGIEPLFLTLLPHAFGTMWRDDPHYVKKGNWQEVKDTVGRAAAEKACPGMITTSWDDGGLHNQAWMPRFICGGQYSWKGDSCDVTTFARRYFRSYFGPAARDMRELFQNMMEGALFWYDTFQRGVFQFCEIGKIHAPDFPREGLEFNDFWRKRYVYLVNRARAMKITVLRAIEVIDDNLARNVRHRYDLEVFRACAEIMRHNCDLIVGLWDLEEAISWASDLHFADRWPCYAPPGFQTRVEYPDWAKALEHLKKAQAVLETNNADRDRTYADLVAVFERTRLPKGLSLPGKPYVFDRERARHLANRTPDMSFMILDEKLLGLDEYLEKLKVLIEGYEKEVSGNRETS
jgi:hypothetical protein